MGDVPSSNFYNFKKSSRATEDEYVANAVLADLDWDDISK